LQIIAANLSKAGFSWGCSSQVDSTGRKLFTADAYAHDGRRFTVLADERLTAFLELEQVTGVSKLGSPTREYEVLGNHRLQFE
jgi:hypothetical protein